jgi:hypothetical protein
MCAIDRLKRGEVKSMIKARINFSKKLRNWDGFGVNYVETCQTADYEENPQDYGGFSTLSESKRQEIIELIFGDDGLKPGIVKMFLDPFHQKQKGDDKEAVNTINQSNYDHETTTKWMRYFIDHGLSTSRKTGRDLEIITTLYGPPAWMTKQGFLRGRDLNPNYKLELAKYMVSWVQYLKKNGTPIKYLSLHNEGEDFTRWPEDGSESYLDHGHDYNMYWNEDLVAEFLILTRELLDANQLKEIGITPGETTNWYRFQEWGYAESIADNSCAMESLGLITSHGFVVLNSNRWFSDGRSTGVDFLREKRPELHAWTTSISWKSMDIEFLKEFRYNIYATKVNAIIPWACVQWSSKWVGGDPNPGTAFRVDGNGNYSIEQGYYYYKQLCRAGQPGMSISSVCCNDTELQFIGFSSNGTTNPDAFILLNVSNEDKLVVIEVEGSNSKIFEGYRTSDQEQYVCIGDYRLLNNTLEYCAPARSATTMYGKQDKGD